jgi:hypothetical protein
VAEDQPDVPKEIRNATIVIGLETIGLLVAAVVLLIKIITGHPAKLWGAFAEVGFVLVGVAILALCARGILRLNPAARTPIVIIQLLALPVAFDLAFQAGLVAYGGPILVAALAVLYLLFTPPARAALDRVPD